MMFFSVRIRLFFWLACFGVSQVNASPVCNPEIHLGDRYQTLASALVHLANTGNFSLSFPRALDRPVEVDTTLPLDQMIRLLTRNLNTMLRHKQSTACPQGRLVELIVLPEGEASDFVTVEKKSRPASTDSYLYIEDMDAYARAVKNGVHKANRHLMTPEQRVAYKYARRKLQKSRHDDF